MPATVGAIHYTGTTQPGTGTGTTSIENDATAGLKWNRSDDNLTTSPIPVPTATGVNYSFYKLVGLKVTATSTTTINNRRVSSAAAPSGVAIFAKDFGAGSSYAQAATGNRPADSTGSNTPTPAGYTGLTDWAGGTSAALQWDNTSVATSATGLNGHLVALVAGVAANYAGGGGTNQTAPTLTVQYDEF